VTAPFDLPDRADLYAPAQGTPYATDVPCRQVPAYAKTGNTVSSSQNPIYTHWVDFNPAPMVRDQATMTYPRINLTSPGDRIELFTDTSILTLQVLWVEDRYSNTEKAYQRAYCVRVNRSIL